MNTQAVTVLGLPSEDIKQKTLSSVLRNIGQDLASNALSQVEIESMARKIDAAFRALESGGEPGLAAIEISSNYSIVSIRYPSCEQLNGMVLKMMSEFVGKQVTPEMQQHIASTLRHQIIKSIEVAIELKGVLTFTGARIS